MKKKCNKIFDLKIKWKTELKFRITMKEKKT